MPPTPECPIEGSDGYKWCLSLDKCIGPNASCPGSTAGCDYVKYYYPTCKDTTSGSSFRPANCYDLGRMCKAAFNDDESIAKCVSYTSLSKNNTYLTSFKNSTDVSEACCGSSPNSKCGNKIPVQNATCTWDVSSQEAFHVGADSEGACQPINPESQNTSCGTIKTESDCCGHECKWVPANETKVDTPLTCTPFKSKTEEEAVKKYHRDHRS